MKETDIYKSADNALKNMWANPRVIGKEKIREYIRGAWSGERARADL